MKLGRFQLKTLQYYSDGRDQNLSFYGWASRCWKYYLFAGLYIVFLIGSDLVLGVSTTSYVFYGAIAGLFFRDIATYYRLRQNWPMLRKVLNWEEIDELLSKNQA